MGKAALALVSAALLVCCGEHEPPAYPPGTVLAVAGAPISAAEVEAAERRVQLIFPSRTSEFTKSKALESFVLPQAAVRAARAAERARAEADAAAAWERIRAGETPEPEAHCGTADDLSLCLWATGRDLEPGAWSGPVERIGAFSLVQLVSREGFEKRESEERICIRVLDFSYLPAAFSPADLDLALAAAKLEIVDPAYASIVPEYLRYLMKGTTTP